jgi:lysophospholipase L1-like esterase
VADKKRIMCFGDSLTWGWIPVAEGVPTSRYPSSQRWTGVMASHLGSDFEIVEEGLSARTTSLDDPVDPRLNGSSYLPSALASHLPLDLVILMLGTNDSKSTFRRTPLEIANGVFKLIVQIAGSAGGVGTTYPAPRTLLIAPPPLTPMPDPWFAALFEGGYEKTKELAKLYRAVASFLKSDFLNAGDFITTDGIDGIHFTVQNNADLGRAVADKVKQIFSPG